MLFTIFALKDALACAERNCPEENAIRKEKRNGKFKKNTPREVVRAALLENEETAPAEQNIVDIKNGLKSAKKDQKTIRNVTEES